MTEGYLTGRMKCSRRKLFCRHLAVICLISVMFLFALTGCSGAADTETESDVIDIGSEESAATETAIELTEDVDAEITELFNTYFDSLSKGDVDSLSKIMVNAPDQETVDKEIEYIENYENIKCYSKDGLLDDTYVVYVYYEVKFKNIDTLAPSLIREYVCTNEDGALYINNGTVDGEIAAWLEEVNNSESAQKLVEEVNNALSEAAQSDEKLAALIQKLNEGAASAESSEEAEGETTEAESAEAETTEAETTEAETTKEETTVAETEYEKFDSEVTMYAAENLNIRKSASTDSEVLGKLIQGDSITAIGTKGDWTVVSYKDTKAYILSELLTETKPDTVSFNSVNEQVVATQNVRMRTSPSTSADVIGNLPGGTTVTRTGYNSEWSRILYNGETVYVASEYLN